MTFEEYKKSCIDSYLNFKNSVWKDWPYSNMHNVCRVKDIGITSYICGGESYIVANLDDGKPRVAVLVDSYDANAIFKVEPYGGGDDKGVVDEFMRSVLKIDNNLENYVKRNVVLAKAIKSWLNELSHEVKERTLKDRERKERKALEERYARDKAVLEVIG